MKITQTGTEERYRGLKICAVINFCWWYQITHVVVPKYTDPLKKVRVIKVIETLSAQTCELAPVSDVKAKNFYFQVKFINCYLRKIISFTKNNDIRDWGQSILLSLHSFCERKENNQYLNFLHACFLLLCPLPIFFSKSTF